jgi:hypothetical protein
MNYVGDMLSIDLEKADRKKSRHKDVARKLNSSPIIIRDSIFQCWTQI